MISLPTQSPSGVGPGERSCRRGTDYNDSLPPPAAEGSKRTQRNKRTQRTQRYRTPSASTSAPVLREGRRRVPMWNHSGCESPHFP